MDNNFITGASNTPIGDVYDVVIVGTGVAGLFAALSATLGAWHGH